ncbi:MAG: IS1182 family transposase [Emergencia sp.]|nr:IS1182 family transposase [Emergencia sp.]
MNLNIIIPDDDSVRLLSQFVEEMDMTCLYETYSMFKENQVTPRQMLKIVLYAYIDGKYSSRDIERACHRDINYMYLLEGKPVPDHATIARFRSLHFSPCAKHLLTECTELLFELGEISGKNIFIDGTKIEANANRYTFVWKRAVTKNQEKLGEKAASLVAECVETYALKPVWHGRVKIKTLKKLRKKLYAIKEQECIEFVYGSGKRKTPLQKHIEQLEGCLEKMKEYNHKIHVCGKRNSYSKTDTPALVPFLEDMSQNLSFKYMNIVADAGYESEENYSYIEDHGQFAYIKPSNYEISKTRKYRADISNRENMVYDEEQDCYCCSQGNPLKAAGTRQRQTASGYIATKVIYKCSDCTDCPVKGRCIKGNHWKVPESERFKSLEVSRKFERQRAESLERITSEQGIVLRINRSIQSEGSFADLKWDRGFRRFLCRGSTNVYAECVLLAISHNIKKLHNKIQHGNTGVYLHRENKVA